MKIKDLSIYKDETYYIEAKAKKYTITINDIENSDGSKTNVELSAHFGERFDFSSLKDTGTNIAPNFTKYKGITSLVEADKERDLTQIIDKSFANLLSQGYAVKAEYVNNAATITYKFPGLNLEDKKITVKKGSQAPSPLELVSQEELDSLVAPNTVIITGTTPKLGLVTGDASYEVNSEIKSVPKHKISYVTNGGSEIAEQIVAEGSVITEPTQPKRTGYSFEGWYLRCSSCKR
ncbi:MAG: InlB B-repeat-containing protein [Clostridiales bacterium]|nr:InlB B-repeat-containing protein [Clostridiales bacterium]